MRKAISAWMPVILWMGFIFFMSAQIAEVSSVGSDALTDGLLEFICQREVVEEDPVRKMVTIIIRKGAHFAEYAILGIMLYRALHMYSIPFTAACSLALSFAYALSDEFHQLYVPGRSGELRDVLLDTLGAFLGVMILRWVITTRRRRIC